MQYIVCGRVNGFTAKRITQDVTQRIESLSPSRFFQRFLQQLASINAGCRFDRMVCDAIGNISREKSPLLRFPVVVSHWRVNWRRWAIVNSLCFSVYRMYRPASSLYVHYVYYEGTKLLGILWEYLAQIKRNFSSIRDTCFNTREHSRQELRRPTRRTA